MKKNTFIFLTFFAFLNNGKAQQKVETNPVKAATEHAPEPTPPSDEQNAPTAYVEEYFTVIQESPTFGDGKKETLQDYIQEHLLYPITDYRNNIQGRLIATFAVEKDGTLSDIRILKSVGFGGSEECIRLLNSMPKWTPGKLQNKITRLGYTLPIQLTINEKTIIAPYFGDGSSPDLALQAIYKTMRFPKEVLNGKVEGTVEVRFNVEVDGRISNPIIVKGLSSDCDKAVLKALNKMPKWTPAQRNSNKSFVKAENCKLLIPINKKSIE